MNSKRFFTTVFLTGAFFFLGFYSNLYGQIWGNANKTHRSTSIIPTGGKIVFSLSNHLFFSQDLGHTFTVDNGSSSNNVSGFTTGNGVFYFSSPDGLFSSPAFDDLNNENWKRIDSTNIPAITSLYVRASADAPQNDEIFVGTASGLWHRTSDVKTWEKLHDGLDGLPIEQITAFNKNIYYRTLTTAWASHDGGKNWASIAGAVSNGNKTGIIATSDNDVLLAVSGNPGSHILHSTDGGNNFNGFKGIDFGTRTIETLVQNANGDLYLGGGVRDDNKPDSITQGYVFRFLVGAFWEDYSTGLPAGAPVPEIIGMGFGANGSIFAGTDSAGLWRSLLPSGVKQQTAQNGIALSGNYPNPVNTYTEFSVFTDHSIKASLEIFDALGRNVMQLSDDQITPGTHFYRVDTKSFTNGTYFYRLQTPEAILSRSFVINK